MSDNSQKSKPLEVLKKVSAAVVAQVAAVSGAVAATKIAPEVQGIINNGNPSIVQQLPAKNAPKSPLELAQSMSDMFNVAAEARADAKGKAGEQSAQIEGANAAKNALKGSSSSPAPKDTSKAVSALTNSSSSATKGTGASTSKGSLSGGQSSGGSSSGKSSGGQSR